MPISLNKSLEKTNISASPRQAPNNRVQDKNNPLKISTEPITVDRGKVGELVKTLISESVKPEKLITEDQVVYDDPVLSERYKELANFGINPLRTEIITIHEYIPVSTITTDENSAKINLNLGENTKINVTNVARLIELHRQIREYTMNAAEKVLERIYAVKSSSSFLRYIKRATIDNLNNAIDENDLSVSKTIKNIQNYIIEGYQTATIKDSLAFSESIKKSKDDPYTLSLIEYFLYEIIVLDMIKYISSIAFMEEYSNNVWDISEFIKKYPFDPSTAINSQNIKFSYENSQNLKIRSGNPFKSVTGISRKETDSNYDLITSILTQILSLVQHRDSITYLESLQNSGQSIEKGAGKILMGLSGDLGRQIEKLKLFDQRCMTAGCNQSVRLTNTPLNFNFVTNNDLFNFYKGNIKSFEGESPAETMQISEVLSAIAFDASSFKSDWFLHKNNGEDLSDLFTSIFGVNTNVEIADNKFIFSRNSLINYLVLASGLGSIPKKFDQSSMEFDKKVYTSNLQDRQFEFNASGKSKLIEEISPISTDPSTQEMYLPIENTHNKSFLKRGEVLTGPEFYLRNELTKENPDFLLLDDFGKKYSNTVNKFIDDMFILAPDNDSSPERIGPLRFMINVLKALVEDISAIESESGERILPILSSFLNTHGSGCKRDAMQGVYWGFAGSSDHTITYDSDSKDMDVSSGNYKKIIKTAKNLVERNNEKSSYIFLKSTIGNLDTNRENYQEVDGDYLVWMGFGGNDPYDGNEVGDSNLTNFDVNTSSSNLSFDGSKKTVSIKRDLIDNVFAKSFSFNPTLTLKDALRKGDASKIQDKIGYSRLIKNSLSAIGEIFIDDETRLPLGAGESNIPESPSINNYSSFFSYSLNKDLVYWNDHPLQHGAIHQFSACQRILYWYYWVNHLFSKNIPVKLSTLKGQKTNGERNGSEDRLVLKMSMASIRGIKKGIVDAISEIETGEVSQYPSNSTNLFNETYQNAKSQTLELLNTIKKRHDMIKDSLALLAAHADAISKFSKEAKDKLSGIDSNNTSTKKRMLTQSILNKNDLISPKSLVPLITNQTVTNSFLSYANNFKRYKDTLFPNDMKYDLSKNKLMFKVLSTPGYGLLSDEKRGNKSIVTVGMPASMIESLQRKAFQETNDINFLNSPYFAISIYKKDHLNSDLILFPKVFVFDTSANILDYNISLASGDISPANHLRYFNGDSSLNEILQTIEITRLGPDKSGVLTKKLGYGYPDGIFNKDILINHVYDYVLKEYMRSTSGIDLGTQSFLLKNNSINFNRVMPTLGSGENVIKEFEKLIGYLNTIYPEAQNDQQLASEVFRMTRILKNTIPFNLTNRINKTMLPSAFDKTYNVLINEKDFVLTSNDTSQIFFENNPTFSFTSKISRPNITSLNSSIANLSSLDIKNYKYAKGTKENSPEVYNYYATISILPIDFMPGAILKFNAEVDVEDTDSIVSKTPKKIDGVSSSMFTSPVK